MSEHKLQTDCTPQNKLSGRYQLKYVCMCLIECLNDKEKKCLRMKCIWSV